MPILRILIVTASLLAVRSYGAKPAWYGSGSGPANDALFAQEIGKFHPFAGGQPLFDMEHSKHRYSRARMALASELRLPTPPPAPPSRFAAVRCFHALLKVIRSAFIEEGPTTEIPDIVDFRDRNLMTYRYEVDPQLTFPDPEIIATLYHGVGALHLSHAGVTAPLVRSLSYPKDRRYKEIAKLLKKEGLNPIRILAETMDLPMAGNFLGHFEFDQETKKKWGTPRAVGQTLGTHLNSRRQRYPGMPSVGFGFSAGAAISGMPELSEQHDMLVLIGPVIPGVAAGYADSRDQLFRLADDLFIPNWEAFYWADTVISQMNWGDLETPFPKPTLILVGENDTDVPESTLRWLELQASRFSHVHFHRIKDAEHNVLKGRAIKDASGNKIRDYEPTEAFAIIHRFLRTYGVR